MDDATATKAVIRLSKRLPHGWGLGGLSARNDEDGNTVQYMVYVFNSRAQPSPDNIRYGYGVTIKAAFAAAVRAIYGPPQPSNAIIYDAIRTKSQH